ncbi:MAG: DUF29 domain-containing protein [Xenococcaceae cyanobacterium]
MTTQLPITTKELRILYEQDYYLWLKNTAKLLRSGRLSELDVDNLVEEIEDMGRSEKRAIYSNLKILLMHLLKYRYQPEFRSNSWSSWRSTIEEHRQRIQKAFEDSPSLKRYFNEIFAVGKCYQDAKRLAAKEIDLALDAFPSESPFTGEEILNPDYLPD